VNATGLEDPAPHGVELEPLECAVSTPLTETFAVTV
jgi:hypothetical protein